MMGEVGGERATYGEDGRTGVGATAAEGVVDDGAVAFAGF